ncbi:MAG: hypothetical protein V3T83_21870, partial [Acidobacteriota bacterium]
EGVAFNSPGQRSATLGWQPGKAVPRRGSTASARLARHQCCQINPKGSLSPQSIPYFFSANSFWNAWSRKGKADN